MLKKEITLVNGVAIAISMVIGSGLFGLPGLAIKETNSITALISWVLVVLMMLPLIYIFSWLGSKYPSSEGISLYASMGLGKWSRSGIMMITCGTLFVGMPAFFLVGGSYIATLLNLDVTKWFVPFALLLALITTAINLLGVAKLGLINKGIVILVILLVGYISIRSFSSIHLSLYSIETSSLTTIPVSQIWLAMSIIFWAFQGWENMTFGFGEVKNPKLNIPLIYWLSFLLVSIVYIVFALAIFSGSQQGIDVSGLSGVASLLPNDIFGKSALIIIVLVLFANANSWVFGTSRAFYSAVKLGVLPKGLAKLNNKGIPVRLLLFSLVLYSLVIISIWYFNIDESYAFLLTTQGFIILYGGALIAFMREARKLWQWGIGLLASASWFFLIQGFGWLIVYPIALMLIGCILKFRHSQE